jgi:hypothetical protein
MADRVSTQSSEGGPRLGPTPFQKAVAAGWALLAAAFGAIAVRALVEGASAWWGWASVALGCLGVAALNWHARRVVRWLSGRRS